MSTISFTVFQLPNNLISAYWIKIIERFEQRIFGQYNKHSRWHHNEPIILFAGINENQLVSSHQDELIVMEKRQKDLLIVSGNMIESQIYIVGYKIGSFQSDVRYHSSKGGILPSYRKRGIASHLQKQAENLARLRGVDLFAFNSFPARFPEMIKFGLKHGFEINACSLVDNELKFGFIKSLKGSSVPTEFHSDIILHQQVDDIILINTSDNEKVLEYVNMYHTLILGVKKVKENWNIVFGLIFL